MTDTIASTHPYDLEVGPVPHSQVLFQWAVRKHGKVFERCDRSFPSEAEARKKGQAAVERLLSDYQR